MKTLRNIWHFEQMISNWGQTSLGIIYKERCYVPSWELVSKQVSVFSMPGALAQWTRCWSSVRVMLQVVCFVMFLSFVLSAHWWFLEQTSAYANSKIPSLKKGVVISIHHLFECLVTTSINTIEQKMSQAGWKNLFIAFQGEVYFQLFSFALAPVIYKTTEPSGVNYIWLTE